MAVIYLIPLRLNIENRGIAKAMLKDVSIALWSSRAEIQADNLLHSGCSQAAWK